MTINAGNGVRDYYFGETPLVITDKFSSFINNPKFLDYITDTNEFFNIYLRIQFPEIPSVVDLIKELNLSVKYTEQITLLDAIHTLLISLSEAETIIPTSVFNLSLRIDFFESQNLIELFKSLNLFIQFSESVSPIEFLKNLNLNLSYSEVISEVEEDYIAVSDLHLIVASGLSDFFISEQQPLIDIFKQVSLFVKQSESVNLVDVAEFKTFAEYSDSFSEVDLYKFSLFTQFSESQSLLDYIKSVSLVVKYLDSVSATDVARLKTFQSFAESLTESERYLFELFLSFSEFISQSDVFKVDTIRVFYSEDFTIRDKVTIQTDVTYREILSSLIDKYSMGLFIRFSENVSPIDLLKDLNLNLSYSESVAAVEEDYIAFSDLHLIVAGGISDFFIGEQQSLLDYIKSVSLIVKYADSVNATDIVRLKSFQLFQESVSEVDRFNLSSFIKFAESGNLIDVFKSVRLTTSYSEVVNAIDVAELKAFLEFSEEITESDRFNLSSFIKFTELLFASDVFKSVNLSLNYTESLTLVDVAYIAFSDLHLIVSGGISDFFIGEQQSLVDVFKSVSLSILKSQIIPSRDIFSVFISGIRFSDSITEVDVADFKVFSKFYESLSLFDVMTINKILVQYFENENARDIILIMWENVSADQITSLDEIKFLWLESSSELISGTDVLNVFLKTEQLESISFVDVANVYTSNIGVIVGNGNQDYFITDIPDIIDRFKSASLEIQYLDSFSALSAIDVFLKVNYSDALSFVVLYDINLFTQFFEIFPIKSKFNVSLQDRYTDILDVLKDSVSIVTGLYFSDEFLSILDEIVFLWTFSSNEVVSVLDFINSRLQIKFDEIEVADSDFVIAFSLEGVIVGNGNQVDFIGENVLLDETFNILSKILYTEEFSPVDVSIFKNFSSYSEFINSVDVASEIFREISAESLRMYDGWIIFYPLDFSEFFSSLDLFQTALKTKFSDGVVETETFSVKTGRSFVDSIPVLREFYHFALKLGFSEEISAEDLFTILSKERIEEVVSVGVSINFVLNKLISELFVILDNFNVFIRINFDEKISASDVYSRFSSLVFSEQQTHKEKFRPKFTSIQRDRVNATDVERDVLVVDVDESVSLIETLNTHSVLSFSEKGGSIEGISVDFYSLFKESMEALDLEKGQFVFEENEKSGWHDPIQINLAVSYFETHEIVDVASVVSIYPYYQQIISLFESYGLSDIVLVHDIKSVDYSRETPVVIIPKNFEVKEVFNGYVTDITMEVIIATPDEEQFAEMKSSMKRVISNSSFSYNLPLIWVKSQSYDPNPKGLYREFYIVNVKSYQPKVVV